MNASGVIQSASDSVEHVFGWTPTELFGRNVSVLIPEPRRSDLDRYLDRYRRAVPGTSLRRVHRFDAQRKDGSILPVELSMSRADLPAQVGPYFIGIIRDVSADIDVGEDASSERSRLQHLVTEQTRALATANLRLHLADRLASLGTLAAGLGHDMNNVLLPVRTRLNALEHAGVTATARGHIAAVRRSVAYLQQLSDALHFIAQDPDGPRAPSEGDGATDLGRWWAQVGPLLRNGLPKHVKLEASFPARLPPIRIAPHWLTQAVLNLIINAGESIPISGSRRRGRVRVWADTIKHGRAVRLGVTDNGRGMRPATQRRAFDLFFTTKARGMGTGLGLPLARKVALRAGGDVELKSEPGKGTTAMLILPASDPTSGRAAASSPPLRTAAMNVRNVRTAALILQMLSAAGLAVKPTNRVKPGNASLWVTDPTATALVVARAWRRRSPARAILLVGHPAERSRVAWEALGATVIDPADDVETIRHALSVVLRGLPNGS